MITETEYEQVQALLRKQGRSGSSKYEFPFIGCIRCSECGGGITAYEKVKYMCPNPKCKTGQTSKNPGKCRVCGCSITKETISKGNWYDYYLCTKKIKKSDGTKCSQKNIRQEVLEDQFIKILQEYQIDPDIEAWALKWLEWINEQKFEDKKQEDTVCARKITTCDNILKNLITMRAKDQITDEEYEKQRKETEEEIQKYVKIREQNESGRSEWMDQAEEEMDFIKGIVHRFQNGTIKEKKFIFQRIGLNFKLKGDKLLMDIRMPFLAIKNLKDEADTRIEPKEFESIPAKEVHSKLSHSNWYPR